MNLAARARLTHFLTHKFRQPLCTQNIFTQFHLIFVFVLRTNICRFENTLYSGPEKGMHILKIRAAARPPPLVCLSAIFAKIFEKHAIQDKPYSVPLYSA